MVGAFLHLYILVGFFHTNKMEKSMQEKCKAERFGIQRYVLLWALLSFLGWIFETVFVFFSFGEWQNRGFLTLPLCPIYGSALMIVFWLAGTPDEPRGLLKNIQNDLSRYALYACIAFLVPSIAEFIVGFIFDKGFGVWLWDYHHLAWNVMGYVCLPISLCWMGLICVFMKWVFPWIKTRISRLSSKHSYIASLALVLVISIDFVWNVVHKLL